MAIDSNTSDRFDSIVETIFRHKAKIIGIPLLVVGLGVLVILFFPRRYTSEARLLLQVGRESVGIDPTASTNEMIQLQQSGRDDEMTSAVDVLQSRAVLGKVVDTLGPEFILEQGDNDEPGNPAMEAVGRAVGEVMALVKSIDRISPREEAILEMVDSFGVHVERGSTVLRLTMEADSAETARAILDQVIKTFQQVHMQIHRNPDSQQFFDDQLATLRAQLVDSQAKLREAKNDLGIVSVETRRETLEGELRDIELSKYHAEQDLANALATRRELIAQLDAIPARELGDRTTMPNSSADQLTSQLYALKVKQLELKSRYQDDHPMVKAINAQVVEAQQVVDSEDITREQVTDRVNPIFESLTMQLKQQESLKSGLEARLETLNEQWQLVMRDLRALNEAEIRINDLLRSVAISEKQFYKYADDLEQARIDSELEIQRISNIRIPQEASLIEQPVSPSKALVGVGSLMLALGATVATVVASERLNSKVRTPNEAETALSLPVFATISDNTRVGRLIG